MEKNLKRRGKKEELSLSTSTSKLLEYISILEAKIEDTSRKDKSLLEEEEEKKEIEELTEKLNLSFREEKKETLEEERDIVLEKNLVLGKERDILEIDKKEESIAEDFIIDFDIDFD